MKYLTGLLLFSLHLQFSKESTQVETCQYPYVRDGKSAGGQLKRLLETQLFGQHLVHLALISKIENHLNKQSPTSPLTLSLHGWPGSGKSLTAHIVAEAMFGKGVNSPFVKIFTASYHFPDPEKVKEYKTLLKSNITEMVSACPTSLFVFDEVDKLHSGLLDALVPFISHTGPTLDGVNYKKAVFLFLGNAGSDAIVNTTLRHLKDGRKRTDLTISDYHDILSEQALNSTGGWYKAEMIERILVDWFIPYLPLERRHVIHCFKELAKKETGIEFTDSEFEKMADKITYMPKEQPLFSSTGCKRVESILRYEITLKIELAHVGKEL